MCQRRHNVDQLGFELHLVSKVKAQSRGSAVQQTVVLHLLLIVQEDDRRAAYNSDITYVTNSELGFDYLRDNLAQASTLIGAFCSNGPHGGNIPSLVLVCIKSCVIVIYKFLFKLHCLDCYCHVLD